MQPGTVLIIGGVVVLVGWAVVSVGWESVRPRIDRLTHADRWRFTLALPIVLVIAGLLAGAVDAWQRLDQAFVIDSFDLRMSIAPDGTTVIEEDILVTFSRSRRGIIRELPPERTTTQRPAGTLSQAPVLSSGDLAEEDEQGPQPQHDRDYEVLDATVDGEDAVIRTWRESGRYHVRFGSQNVWLEPGTYRYHLRYRAPSWTQRSSSNAELAETRINVPGFEWPTRIEQVSVAIWTPGDPDRPACVWGPAGSRRSCDDAVRVEDGVLRANLGPFADRSGATIAVHSPVAAFSFEPPVGRSEPLGSGWAIPRLTLPRSLAGMLLALVVALPLAGVALHERSLIDGPHRRRMRRQDTPTVLVHPPENLEPVEVAGLLFRHTRGDQLLLSRLIRASQQGAIEAHLAADRAHFAPVEDDGQDLEAPLHTLLPLDMTDDYDAGVADRITSAQQVLERRARNVFAEAGLDRRDRTLHDRLHRLPVLWGVAGALALALAVLGVIATPLTIWTGLAVLVVVLAVAGAHRLLWAGRGTPLTDEGVDLMRLAEAFDHYLDTVEAEQLTWAATQDDTDHRHPAVALLPYAVALGRGEAWHERFGPLMRQHAPDDWATASSAPRHFRQLHHATCTAPTSSSDQGSGGGFGGSFSGGGGAGSGGGGGGGRSW